MTVWLGSTVQNSREHHNNSVPTNKMQSTQKNKKKKNTSTLPFVTIVWTFIEEMSLVKKILQILFQIKFGIIIVNIVLQFLDRRVIGSFVNVSIATPTLWLSWVWVYVDFKQTQHEQSFRKLYYSLNLTKHMKMFLTLSQFWCMYLLTLSWLPGKEPWNLKLNYIKKNLYHVLCG